MENVEFKHTPVLLKETLEALDCKQSGKYLDCTVGGAGHSSQILKIIGEQGYLYGIDRDNVALKTSEYRLSEIGKNFSLIKGNYSDLKSLASEYNLPELDGILIDLGVSSYQLDTAERGFSFSKEAKLDMRLGQDEDETKSAYDLVNTLSKSDLELIFKEYGEEPYSRIIAEEIVKTRKVKKIETTSELSNVVIEALRSKKYVGSIHPATRIFQAIRIKVNNELDGIKDVLPSALSLLKDGGRLAVITFHSLEDRIVKDMFKDFTKNCICPPRQPICTCQKKREGVIITKKPLTASEEELKLNPRARSAKLRVFEKHNADKHI